MAAPTFRHPVCNRIAINRRVFGRDDYLDGISGSLTEAAVWRKKEEAKEPALPAPRLCQSQVALPPDDCTKCLIALLLFRRLRRDDLPLPVTLYPSVGEAILAANILPFICPF